MEEKIALKIPGLGEITAPPGVPTGGTNTLGRAIGVGISLFLTVVIIASLAYLVWAGTKWIRSSGDPQKIDEARKQIIFAIIGLLIAFFAFGVIGALSAVFNIDLLNFGST